LLVPVIYLQAQFEPRQLDKCLQSWASPLDVL